MTVPLDVHATDEELLAFIDREVPPGRRSRIEAHIARCAGCQRRRAAFERATGRFAEDYSGPGNGDGVPPGDARRRLLSALDADARAAPSRNVLPLRSLRPMAAAALVVAALLVGVLLPRWTMDRSPQADGEEGSALPIAALTPGVTWNLTVTELCAEGTREQREVPAVTRAQVLRAYGMQDVQPGAYELDYLITPALGGAPDARNLWPQRYASRVWHPHVKDQLERVLPKLVCRGQVALAAAQQDIARDWIAAYKKYFHTDVPLLAAAETDTDPPGTESVMYPVWRPAAAPSLELIAFAPGR